MEVLGVGRGNVGARKGEGDGGSRAAARSLKRTGVPDSAPHPERTGQARRIAVAGLGLFLAWMMSLLLRGGVLSGPYAGQRSLSFDPFFAAAVAAAAVCLAAFSLPLRFLERRLDRTGTIVAVGLCVAAAGVATGVLGVVPFDAAPAPIGLGVVCGGCVAVMLMLWLLVFASFDPRDTVVMVLIDILIALGGFLVIHFAGKVLLSPPVTTAASIAFLAASFALLVRERAFLGDSHGSIQEPTSTLVKLALFAFVTSAVVEYALGFMVVAGREFFFQGTHDRFLLQIAGLGICAAVTAALAVALRVLDKRTGTVVVVLYRIIVLVLIGGLVMALLPFERIYVPADTVILLARFLVFFGTWAIGLHAVFLQGRDVIGAIALLLTSQFLGLLIGFLLGLQISSVGADAFWPQVGLAVGVGALVVVTLFVFTDLDVNAVERVGLREAAGSGGTTLDDRVARARECFGLTEREGEVLRLLATGRNAASIQEALCVSYNTVKVHKRNIYLKMDIHSQQELLDVMETIDVLPEYRSMF